MATEAAGIDRPLLVDDFLQRRRYQLQLADAAADEHTLVCLPTGLGKTTVSLLVTAERLHQAGGKALFLAPTKPLVQQHADFYREALSVPDDDIVVFTGDVKPDDRAALWDDARIVIATPQVVENDLVGNRISLRDVTHLTFDECHRATGDYAYVYIAERYHADAADPLVTGMSASPGGDTEEIETVCENLGLVNVEVMTEEDADVDEYTHDTDVQWEQVTLPDEVLDIRDALNEVITDRLEKLKQLGVTNTTNPDLSQKDLNKMRGQLKQMMDNDQSDGYKGMSTHAEVMKLRRATELVETQSVESVRRYFERQREAARSSGASKASQRMVADPKVREAMRKAESFDGLHPKFSKARILLAETLGINGGERAILFTESRDTAEALVEFLSASFDVRKFVGQGDKEGSDGMSQTQQQETLDEFKNGEFEVLVSTSVAEEGLDVPEVDLVCFYEPVPTAIRSIQRKGRTGRQAEGKVVVLMAEDTRDEAFFWISRRREKKMASQLAELKEATDDIEENVGDDGQAGLDAFGGGSGNRGENADAEAELEESADAIDEDSDDAGDDDAGLTDFAEEAREGEDDVSDESEASGEAEAGDDDADDDGVVATAGVDDGVEVVVDQRELDSSIAKDLSTRDGLVTRLETLAVGDYVLSDRVAVERKSAADFVDSMLDGDRSMFEQIGELSRAYARPVMVVEGTNLYGQRDIEPNAIRGALASLAVDFDVSVLRTEGESDTTELLATIAKREQETRDREVSVHGEKTTKTRAEQQEYVVSAIADIGPVTARTLLEHFGTVEAVMTAPEDDLLEVDGVGPVTAERIREVVGSEYE
ncbi:DEAD/DEAH box helicase [Halorubrum distributum]|uniref:DEAD/DEAH box helicase n=1 Tax=Halorubrum distributum TaxID=29283 RepID=A0A6B1IXY5_9EURY|nr:DEAD/DEAH box helicase [Halorubrum terrestre]MYL17830.1 DEAD/DEAH box helicase [Halorubrum terrestre]MYL67576.1 DEAD/DEAH box helicase [Halorubrum terrestre]